MEADSELLSLVWNNLFSNAVKFTEAGGTLSLTLEAQEDLAVGSGGGHRLRHPPRGGENTSLRSSTRGIPPTPPRATAWAWLW